VALAGEVVARRNWPAAIDSAVDAMARLYAALAPVLIALSRG
jgi:hypothetical protein